MAAVQSLCSRVIVLNNGKLSYEGNVDGGINQYLNSSKEVTTVKSSNTEFTIKDIAYKNSRGNKVQSVLLGDQFSIHLKYISNVNISHLIVRMIIRDSMHRPLSVLSNFHSSKEFNVSQNEGNISCIIEKNPLYQGTYHISLLIFDNSNRKVYLDEDVFCHLEVVDGDFFGSGKLPKTKEKGVFLMNNSWVCS
jgi:lipopolysaccharide transport system ATP-binding protein